MSYKQLTEMDRSAIEVLLDEGKSIRSIAEKLNRSPGTISREIKRNKNQKTGQYIAEKAQQKSQKRLTDQRTKAPLKKPLLFLYVREKLRLGWTPEEIAGRLPLDHPGESIHHETIYRYIYNSKKTRGMELWKYLKNHRKKRMKKNGRKVQRSKIKDAIRIDERDKNVLTRQEIGHWETDNMGGKIYDKSSFSGLIERKTRYVILDVLEDKKAETKTKNLVESLNNFPAKLRKTVTTDNGAENSDHKNWSQQIDNLQVYFCHPYHSWEKGSVENVFTRVRRYIPKGTSIDIIDQKTIKLIQHRLNNTPRKCLNYLTPTESMMLELQKLNKP
jgi:IS30 family transposase